jgi:membrane protease YdiL (CAAX protease family)
MPVFPMAVKLAAYLATVHLTLKYSYRLCSHANNRISSLAAPITVLSLLASLVAVIPLATTLTVTFAFILAADGPPLPIVTLDQTSDALGFTLWGAGLGFVCVMVMFVLGRVAGFIKVQKVDDMERRDRLPSFCGGLTDYLGAAIFEEIAMRGYVFYLLYSEFGAGIAIVASAVVFAAVHLIRPDRIPAVFTLNAFIFGLLTGASRCYTGALWLPIGLHIGWNVTSGPLLGLPYSGVVYDRGIVRSDVKGPQWFTGGLYSLDAGVVGTLALLLAAAVLKLVAPAI